MDAALSITDKVEALIAPIVQEEGLELLDVAWVQEEGRKILRLYLDREEGIVSLEDCRRVSHAIEDLIEIKEVIPAHYDLEVSSPGVNRPLRLIKHFIRVIGKVVRIRTRQSLEGRQNYKGVLKKVEGDSLFLEIDKKEYIVPIQAVEKANLEFFEKI